MVSATCTLDLVPLPLTNINGKLYQMLAFGARKNILLKWVTDKVPSKIRWQRLILYDVSLDYWTCRLHSKDDVF